MKNWHVQSYKYFGIKMQIEPVTGGLFPMLFGFWFEMAKILNFGAKTFTNNMGNKPPEGSIELKHIFDPKYKKERLSLAPTIL